MSGHKSQKSKSARKPKKATKHIAKGAKSQQPPKPDQLSQTSLDWASAHISKFGDTDIFPVPFEFAAIRHGWTAIRDHLASVDLEGYQTRPLQSLLVPKSLTAFRTAVQLDPIDALVYASLIYEAAE